MLKIIPILMRKRTKNLNLFKGKNTSYSMLILDYLLCFPINLKNHDKA